MMKKLLFIAVLFTFAIAAVAQDTATDEVAPEAYLSAYLSCDPPRTCILNKPRGATVMTLDYYYYYDENNESVYILSLTSPQDGWWKIVELWTIEDDVTSSLTGSDTGEYWIHYSALGLDTRNYGEQEIYLRAEPDEEAAVVFTTNKELSLMPLDIHGDWVKVMVCGHGIVGWIEAEWLCSNPLTNCC